MLPTALATLASLVMVAPGSAASSSSVGGAADWNVTCPANCSCAVVADLKTVDCSHRRLKSVPADVPPDTESLDIRGNLISDLQDAVPNLVHLVRLDASNNKLRSIGRGFIFHKLGRLGRLDLAKNNLESVNKDVFRGLTSLESLHLNDNQLNYVENQAFYSLARLRTLDLSSNRLTGVYVEWFSRLANLQLLNVANNHVHHIKSAVLTPLTRLRTAYLQRNRIANIASDAFDGLARLETLRLDDNQLSAVPTQPLRSLPSLRSLHLSANPIAKLRRGDLADLSRGLRELHLVRMPALLVIEERAVANLSSLESLHVSDNPRLAFVDDNAFADLPQLRNLSLHSNRLRAVSKTLVTASLPPTVRLLTLHDNPFLCDCNVRWLRQRLGAPTLAATPAATTTSSGTTDNSSSATASGIVSSSYAMTMTTDARHMECAAPERLAGKSVKDLDLKKIPRECAPTLVLPVVNGTTVERRLGDSYTFECRALGLPPPVLSWVLPGGLVLNQTSNWARLQLRSPGSLTVQHLKVEDSGVYTCTASNALGVQHAQAALAVRRIDIQLFPLSVTSTFVDLVWNGTARNAYPKYILMYRLDQGEEDKYEQVPVSPIMRSYTVGNLQPETSYEFCIAFEDKEEAGHYERVACTKAKTQDAAFMLQGIRRTSNVAVAVVLGIVFAMLAVICAVTAAARKYRRHNEYENPDDDGKSHNHLVTTMSQIPLENLYSPLMSNIGP